MDFSLAKAVRTNFTSSSWSSPREITDMEPPFSPADRCHALQDICCRLGGSSSRVCPYVLPILLPNCKLLCVVTLALPFLLMQRALRLGLFPFPSNVFADDGNIASQSRQMHSCPPIPSSLVPLYLPLPKSPSHACMHAFCAEAASIFFCSFLCSFSHSFTSTCTWTLFSFRQEPATSHPNAICRPLRPQSRAASRSSTPLAVYMDAALILQNKGGGHGEVGFHLAKQLKAKVRPLDLAPSPK